MSGREGGDEMQLLTFVLNDILFGIRVSDVESIESRANIVKIPNSPPNIKGIINLHGNIVPIYSLTARFSYEEQNIQNVVVVGIGGMKIGLEVEVVKEILEVEDRHVIPMPEIMNSSQNYFNNVASYDKKLIVLLDVPKMISAEEQQGILKFIDEKKS